MLTLDLRQEITEKHRNIPFWRLLGLEIEHLEEGYARLLLPAGASLANTKGTLHGGVISSLIDSGGGTALRTLVGFSQLYSTIEMKLNYLQPAVLGNIVAEGRVVRRGGTIAFCTVDVKDDRSQLVATGLATYILLKRS